VNACGAQADAGIIRDGEINRGKYGPLGWTQGGGGCNPEAVIGEYMGTGTAPRYTGGRKPTGKIDDFEVDDEVPGNLDRAERGGKYHVHARKVSKRQSFLNLPIIGSLGLGGERTNYPVETIVGDYAGKGKEHGLPTTDDEGRISLIYRQVGWCVIIHLREHNQKLTCIKINQDGSGPLSAAIDATSAGTDSRAFKSAKVIQNVPGDGFVALSLATNTNFLVKVQVPDGMVCEGKVAGLDNVCFVRVRNNALSGPFGGAGFFTQSEGARKRAVAYRLKKRMERNR
jgi:hypothetical protein